MIWLQPQSLALVRYGCLHVLLGLECVHQAVMSTGIARNRCYYGLPDRLFAEKFWFRRTVP